jgi:MerR family transcriptional regulator/heat shock protein HspR
MVAQRRGREPVELDDVDAALYTVGQVAQMLGVPVAQLRRLDAGDVVRPGRSVGNQRRYTRREIARIREALALTADGVTLAGVRRVLALQDQVADLEDRLARAEARLEAHERERADAT